MVNGAEIQPNVEKKGSERKVTNKNLQVKY